MNMKTGILSIAGLLLCFIYIPTLAQPASKPLPQKVWGIGAIKETDIRADLFAMAADHFRGREPGHWMS